MHSHVWAVLHETFAAKWPTTVLSVFQHSAGGKTYPQNKCSPVFHYIFETAVISQDKRSFTKQPKSALGTCLRGGHCRVSTVKATDHSWDQQKINTAQAAPISSICRVENSKQHSQKLSGKPFLSSRCVRVEGGKSQTSQNQSNPHSNKVILRWQYPFWFQKLRHNEIKAIGNRQSWRSAATGSRRAPRQRMTPQKEEETACWSLLSKRILGIRILGIRTTMQHPIFSTGVLMMCFWKVLFLPSCKRTKVFNPPQTENEVLFSAPFFLSWPASQSDLASLPFLFTVLMYRNQGNFPELSYARGIRVFNKNSSVSLASL